MLTKYTAIVITCLAWAIASPSAAQVYSWQDEQGKMHFGDTIPERYQQQSVTIKLNPSNAIPLNATNQAREPALKNVNIYPDKSQTKRHSSKSSNCKAQIAEYQRNSRCFASCRIGSNNYLNNRCIKLKGCKNMRKPHCK